MDLAECYFCLFKCFLKSEWLWTYTRKLYLYVINFSEIFLFFLIDWIIIAALMEVIFVAFPDTYDNLDYYSFNFKDYFKSLFSMFVFFTSNNSPEILLKNYPGNSLITTFFIVLVWINNVVLIGLLIGLSYYKMKKLMFEDIKKVYENPDKAHIFERMLDHPNAEFPFVKAVLLLYLKDKQIDEDELKKRINAKDRVNPTIYRASEDIFWTLKQSFEYEMVFSLINFIIVCLALWVIHIRDFSKYHFFIIVIGLCFLSLFDLFNNLFFFDLTFYDRMWRTIFDSILNVLIIGISLMILLIDFEGNNLVKIWAFLCLAKQFRLFLVLFRFNRQKFRTHIIYPFTRYLYDIFGLFFVIFLIFGTLCLNLYGGNIHTYTMVVYNNAMETDYEYHHLNFNTILNSFTTLFVIMLNNGWTIIANLAVISDIGKKKIMKFIFTFFKLIVNYILINSLIAITIQIFSEFETRKKGQLKEKLLMGRKQGEKEEELKDEDYSDVFDESDSDKEEVN